jgi:hypothetical protein
MSKHLTVPPNEAADRLSIRELVEAYAHCADRRDAKGQRSLCTPDTSLRYLDAFVKIDGAWLFSERRLYVDWVDERPLS